MKAALLLLVITLFATTGFSQMRVIYPEGIKVKDAPLPSFPVESQNLIYGDEVRVLVAVDGQGKVKGALAYGPLAPCSNLSDPVVEAVKNAALTAAKATTFEPMLKDGKAVEERISIGYSLRGNRALSAEERKVVSIGIANSRAKELPKIEYPESARAAGLRGGISVFALIAETGNAISAGSFSGHPQFAAAGVKAACGARFAPMTLKNEPAKMLAILSFNFNP